MVVPYSEIKRVILLTQLTFQKEDRPDAEQTLDCGRPLGVHEGSEEVVAWSDYVHATVARHAARVYAGLGTGAVYLHAVLG